MRALRTPANTQSGHLCSGRRLSVQLDPQLPDTHTKPVEDYRVSHRRWNNEIPVSKRSIGNASENKNRIEPSQQSKIEHSHWNGAGNLDYVAKPASAGEGEVNQKRVCSARYMATNTHAAFDFGNRISNRGLPSLGG